MHVGLEQDFWRTMGLSSPTQRIVLIGFMLRAEHRPIVHDGPPLQEFYLRIRSGAALAEANPGQPKPGDNRPWGATGLPKPLTPFRLARRPEVRRFGLIAATQLVRDSGSHNFR